jgi:tetratricopeptide (TPR) repeat protein
MKKVLAVFLFFNLQFAAQQKQADSLLNILKITKEDTAKIKTLYSLAFKFSQTNEYEKAMLYAENGLELAGKEYKTPGISVVKANLFSLIAAMYRDMSNYPMALQKYDEALKIHEKNKNKEGMGNTINNIGIIYWYQGNYAKAHEKYLKAYAIREEIGDLKGISASIWSIGMINLSQGDYKKALENYFKALKIKEQLGDKKSIAALYNNIGSVYIYQNNHKEALLQYFKAIKIMEELGEKKNLAASLNNIGVIYQEQGDYNKALEQHLKALQIREELGDDEGISISYNNLGTVYSKLAGTQTSASERLKNFGKAEKYLTNTLFLSKKYGYKEWIKESYQNLTAFDSATGKWQNAYENHKLFINYRDSLLNEENTKKTVEGEMNYAFSKREEATKIEQAKKDVISVEEKQKQKIIIISVSSGLVLVLILAIVIFISLLKNKEKNRIITEQKRLVEDQNKIVEEKQKEVLDSIHYAKRIQTALITSEKYIEKNLNKLAKDH